MGLLELCDDECLTRSSFISEASTDSIPLRHCCVGTGGCCTTLFKLKHQDLFLLEIKGPTQILTMLLAYSIH